MNEEQSKEPEVCLPEGDGEEGREAKPARTLAKVSEEERERHELTHTPFRAWCKFCVMGRGQNESRRKKDEHRKQEEKELIVPRISMDYFLLRGRGQGSKGQSDVCNGG